MFPFTFVQAVATLISLSGIVSAASIPSSLDKYAALDTTAREILARATPTAPHFVIYSDKFVSGETGPPDASAVAVRISNTCIYHVTH